MVDAGLLGRKSGRGFHAHGEGAVRPPPATMPPGPRPRRVQVLGALGPAAALEARAREAGLAVETGPGDGRVVVDGTHLALTDGRPATLRGDVDGLFDLWLDAGAAKRAAVAMADGAGERERLAAAGFFQSLGMEASPVDDIAGMLAMRTVACLANEALDAALQGVAREEDIDAAMTKGVSYPIGPVAWGARIGFARVERVLDNIQGATGDDRFRPSPLLRRRAAAEGRQPRPR
jgi:3-hydroxybutyryl-CoA dehydrogenase